MFHPTPDAHSGQPLLSSSPTSNNHQRGRPSQRTTNLPPGHNNTTSSSRNPLPSRTSRSPLRPRTPMHDPQHPTFSRRSTMRSRSPTTSATRLVDAKKKYTLAAFFLCVSLVSFTVQTELAAYIQHELGWNKAYCMLYLTHSSWIFLWPLQLAFLRLRARDRPWAQFWRRHVWLVRTTAQMVQRQELDPPRGHAAASPWAYLARTTAFVTASLTVAGLSWYLAVSMTTPSDLTAIYNCSAFFAYAFSVPLLKERLRADKSFAVAVAIVGVLVVAYGDGKEHTPPAGDGAAAKVLSGSSRLWGNLIIGAGSVLYGLYEVLYKRLACPPEGTSAGRGVVFANTFGSLIGGFTFLVLWIPLPVLHVLGWETFEPPTGQTAWLLFISVVMNMVFSGSFLVLISLTSPVLSSVAALLTIFIVAVVDWFRTGQPLSAAALLGGLLIIAAFGMLSWSTWREMAEDERRRRQVDLSGDDEDGDDSDKGDD